MVGAYSKNLVLGVQPDAPWITWDTLVPQPTFWQRVKAVFRPERSPVQVYVHFKFKAPKPGAPGEWQTVEATATAPGQIGKVRVGVQAYIDGGELLLPAFPMVAVSPAKKGGA